MKGQCCFWHIIGAPQKDGHEMPLLPYQKLLYRILQERKRIWIKKSRGLGVTTFFLYWIAYCCLTRFQPNDRVCIIVGPRIDAAEDLLARFKNLFSKVAPNLFDRSKSTVAIVNKVKVEVFPSHHVSSARGLDRVRCILSDESDYYPSFQQKEVRAVVEGYIGKPNSDPYIIFVSTPAAPGGLMQTIELEMESLYYKMPLDYHYGLEGPQPIYSKEQIELAKKSPDFDREYVGMYTGLIGNVFSTQSIENCQKIEYDPDQIIPHAKFSIGIDPSFGSSKFGIVATRYVNERIEVVEAEDWYRPDFVDMTNRVWEIKQKHKVDTNNLTIFCDSANPEISSSLKRMLNEPCAEQYVSEKLAYYKKHNINPANYMKVIPVPFSTQGAKMLQHTKSLLEDKDNLVAIDKRFDKLLTSLRTAVANEYKLDKEQTSYHDILDGMRLSLQLYQRSNK